VENNFLAAGLLVQDQILDVFLLRILHLFNVYVGGGIYRRITDPVTLP
jgi:hypothetical protein